MSAPIVALHGWALNRGVYDGIAKEIVAATGREFLALDLPGHGRTPESAALQAAWHSEAVADDLLARMPPRSVVLGWSLGGSIALQMAAQAPQRIAALVLISTTPRFAAASDWSCGADPAVLKGFVAHLSRDYRRTVTEFLELQVRGSMSAEATLKKLRVALERQGDCEPEVLQRAVTWLHRLDLRAVLARIEQPSIVITGQYDRIVHPQASHALAKLLPHARCIEIARCGHAPFLSHPEEFLTVVGEFVRALP